MDRLELPDASEDYYLFNLKVDHIGMMKRIGYIIPDDENTYAVENPEKISDRKDRFAIFRRKYINDEGFVIRSSLDRVYKHIVPTRPEARVSFTHKQSVKLLRNQEYSETMKNPSVSSNHIAIHITKDKPSDDAKSKSYDKTRIIYYLDRQITFDTTEHAFSTRLMKKLSAIEKERFYAQPGMSGKSLKSILSSDPVAVVNGWSADDVIQSYRETVVIGQSRAHISYSVVI